MRPGLWVCTMLLPVAHLTSAGDANAEEATLWEQVSRGGYVLLVRSAATPLARSGAPYTRGGCVQERDIGKVGQALALHLGQVFREHGVPVSRVLASPACPSIETAQIAFGIPETWNTADSDGNASGDRRAWRARNASSLASWTTTTGNLVVVTDKLVISELTNRNVAAGEVLVLKPSGDQLDVAGQLSLSP